jgi:hypothetical protein
MSLAPEIRSTSRAEVASAAPCPQERATPETDAEWLATGVELRKPGTPRRICSEFARRLERERDEARDAEKLSRCRLAIALRLCAQAEPIVLGDTKHDGGEAEDDWIADYRSLWKEIFSS